MKWIKIPIWLHYFNLSIWYSFYLFKYFQIPSRLIET
jgi:hypothetical protein